MEQGFGECDHPHIHATALGGSVGYLASWLARMSSRFRDLLEEVMGSVGRQIGSLAEVCR